MTLSLAKGDRVNRTQLLARFVELQYRRNDHNFARGAFRVRGDTIELFPAHYEDRAWRLSLFGDEIEAIHEIDPLTGEKTAALQSIKIYANSHYVTPRPTLLQAIEQIKRDLKLRLDELHSGGKLLGGAAARTAHHLRSRNDRGDRQLRRHRELFALSDRAQPGEPPPTFFEYMPRDALVFVDESHVTVPQLGGMFRGDWMRKIDPRRIRLPAAVLHRQPAAQIRGMGGAARPDDLCLGDARAAGRWTAPAASLSSRSCGRPASSTRPASFARSRPRSTI